MRALLFLAYPLLVHLAVVAQAPALQWLALQALFGAILANAERAPGPRAWLGWAAFALATALLSVLGGGQLALYVPPVALLGLVLWTFARSLRAGATPLVTRIAEAVRGPQPEPIRRYTRAVTWVWSVELAVLLALTLALTVAGPREWWSLVTNFLNYAAMGLTFLVEYGVRRVRFPGHDREGFVGYLRLLVRQRLPRP